MTLLAASNLGKHFGTRVLFREASFTLNDGARVGLIGPNGCGKTSLFRIMLGDDDHEGTYTCRRDLRIGALDQDPRLPDGANVHEALLSGDPELLELEHGMKEIHDALERGDGDTDRLVERLGDLQHRFEALGGWDAESRADRILEGFGFPKERHGEPVESLSGGERSRIAFGRLLLREPDLWLLDEPTNHLDIEGILFLEKFLREAKAAAVIVSHDRRFLDRVTEETWQIEGQRVWRYPGGYSRARLLRDERIKAESRAFENQQSFIEKQDAFIRRYQAGQRARQATGRKKRLERLERLERPEDRVRVMNLDLSSGESPGSKILALRGLAAGYDGKPLFRGLDLDLDRGEVLGIAGPNGAGKTTLLRVLTKELEPLDGVARWGERVRLGVLTQHEVFPDEASTPYAYLRAAAPRLTELQIRNLLGAMLFPGDAVDRPVRGLSGGERKRLMLARLLTEGNNVLLLDEPTNHLDLPSREALELALAAYDGTLIVISHDRHFLDAMADRMVWVEGGEVHVTEGGFDEAWDRREKRRLTRVEPKPAPKTVERLPSAPPSAPPKRSSPYGNVPTEELEKRIATAEARAKELEASFTNPATYLDPAKLKAAQRELARVEADRAGLENEYLAR